MFKYYIYNGRDRKHLVFEALMKNIKNIYNVEKNLANQDPHKKRKFLKKWQFVEFAIRCNFPSFFYYYYIILLR